jgi:DMSO/TMAO reductase YedYZ molybdopterin-dependent catalytic subunit
MACAGNNRLKFAPLPTGEPWDNSAISTATWQGVALRDVLPPDMLGGDAVEVLFTGADHGTPAGESAEIAFARSLPLEQAMHPDTLLAYAMNGQALPLVHGKPLRLLVPGWYGMASVKWLARITVLREPFKGYYQHRRYVIEQPGQREPLPLRAMAVASHIVSPQPGATLTIGTHTVRGWAWSGYGLINSVEVRDGQDKPWQRARLLGEAQPYTWQAWEWTWEVSTPGRKIVQARASDSSGHTQPEAAAWNRFGYENNTIETLVVTVDAS